MSYLQRLVEAQNSDLHAARAYIDRADEEKRELSHEERTAWDSLNAQMDQRATHIDEVRADEQRALRVESAMSEASELRAPAHVEPPVENVAQILKDLATGKRSSYVFGAETRAVSTSTTAGGYTIPEGFGGRIIEKMLTVGPMLDAGVVNLIQTTSNQDIPFPIENARATGTATAEAATYADSSPTFTQKTLKAYKYGTIVLASEELLNSEDVGLQGYLARNLGVAVGTAVNSILTLGTGTVQPEGIAASAGSGVTGGTGVVGVPTFENLVDLVHSVDSLYAASAAAGFMMRRSTLGSVRKLKDGAGNYIFVPAPAAGMANTLYGYPVYENPYVAATATAAKSILFGDFSYFLVRQVGGVELSRTNDRYWDSDQIGLKVRTWVDSFIGQSEAIKYFAGGTS
jgi:HK97 family phage major capsid protein